MWQGFFVHQWHQLNETEINRNRERRIARDTHISICKLLDRKCYLSMEWCEVDKEGILLRPVELIVSRFQEDDGRVKNIQSKNHEIHPSILLNMMIKSQNLEMQWMALNRLRMMGEGEMYVSPLAMFHFLIFMASSNRYFWRIRSMCYFVLAELGCEMIRLGGGGGGGGLGGISRFTYDEYSGGLHYKQKQLEQKQEQKQKQKQKSLNGQEYWFVKLFEWFQGQVSILLSGSVMVHQAYDNVEEEEQEEKEEEEEEEELEMEKEVEYESHVDGLQVRFCLLTQLLKAMVVMDEYLVRFPVLSQVSKSWYQWWLDVYEEISTSELMKEMDRCIMLTSDPHLLYTLYQCWGYLRWFQYANEVQLISMMNIWRHVYETRDIDILLKHGKITRESIWVRWTCIQMVSSRVFSNQSRCGTHVLYESWLEEAEKKMGPLMQKPEYWQEWIWSSGFQDASVENVVENMFKSLYLDVLCNIKLSMEEKHIKMNQWYQLWHVRHPSFDFTKNNHHHHHMICFGVWDNEMCYRLSSSSSSDFCRLWMKKISMWFMNPHQKSQKAKMMHAQWMDFVCMLSCQSVKTIH
jgi:hypothetical protein